MLVSWVAPVKMKDIGVIQIVGGNRDKDILNLRVQATKDFIIVPGSRRQFFCIEAIFPSLSWSEKRYDYTKSLRARFIVFFEAKFLDIGVLHFVGLATGIYAGRSKPLDASMTIVAARVVLVVKTVRAIITIVVIATIVAIVIFVVTVTVMPSSQSFWN